MGILIGFLLTIHILVCLALVGIVLMQLPRSEGLGAAFGGGVTENVFGAQTSQVLARATVWLGVAFFAVTLLLAIAYAHNRPSAAQFEKDILSSKPAPAAATSPQPAASPAVSPAATSAVQDQAAPVGSATEKTPVGAQPETP